MIPSDYRPTRAELAAGPTPLPGVEAALAAAAEEAAESLDELHAALSRAPTQALLPAVLAAAAAHAAFVRLRLLGPDASVPAEARPLYAWRATAHCSLDGAVLRVRFARALALRRRAASPALRALRLPLRLPFTL